MNDLQKMKQLYDQLGIHYAEENDGILTTLHVDTDAGVDTTGLCFIFSCPDGAYRNSELYAIKDFTDED